jgi:response regulator of citrate/malate metabolism
MYILVVVLEAGIYISHIVWRIRYRELRKEAKASGKSIDNLLVLKRNDTQETQDLEKGVISNSPGDAESQMRVEQTLTPRAERQESIEKC